MAVPISGFTRKKLEKECEHFKNVMLVGMGVSFSEMLARHGQKDTVRNVLSN